MIKTENKETISNFCNYILDLALNDKMNPLPLLEYNLKTFILLRGRRIKYLPYYEFKFKRTDYIKLDGGTKVKGVCYVPACSALGLMVDGGLTTISNLSEDNWSQVIKNIWREEQHT